jgi:hypothetical protein
MVFHPVNSLDGIDVVMGIGSTKLKAVMAYSCFQTTVIEAPVVMAGNTVGALATSLPSFACHALAYLKKVFGVFPEGNHFPGPFVTGNKGIGQRPVPWKSSLDDFGVRAANGYGPDAAENLKGSRGRHRHFLDFELARCG